jgi:hypothetical protein
MKMTVIKHSRLLQPITKGKPNRPAHSLKETKAFSALKLSKRWFCRDIICKPLGNVEANIAVGVTDAREIFRSL